MSTPKAHSYRWALLNQRPKLVHRTDGDETKLTVCGILGASLMDRYSRRDAGPIKLKPLCRNCDKIVESRR